MKYRYVLQHKCMIKNTVSERSQTQRPHTVLVYLYEMSRIDKSMEIGVVRGCSKGAMGSDC